MVASKSGTLLLFGVCFANDMRFNFFFRVIKRFQKLLVS